jgi:hypothetical protein
MPVEHPVPPAEEAASKTRLVAPLRQVFQSAIDDVMAERNARQARLDNPGEYKHVGGACG